MSIIALSLKNMSLNLTKILKAPEAIFLSARGNFLNEFYVQKLQADTCALKLEE